MCYDYVVMTMEIVGRRGLSWDRLRSFCAVAEAGSIVKAAGGDPVRQSLMSRQIGELEQAFGTSLVRRKGRGLVLTEPGRRLAMVARGQMQALADFDDECRDLPARFSLVASNTLLDAVFLPCVRRLREALPAVQWRIGHRMSREAAKEVVEGEADFALLRSDAAPERTERRRLGGFEWVLAMPDGMPAAGAPAARLLPTLPLALPVGGDLRERMEAYAAKAGFALRVALTVDSHRQALQAVMAGACAAVLPSILIPRARAGLRTLPLPAPLRAPETFALVWRRRLLDARRNGPEVLRALSNILTTPAGA